MRRDTNTEQELENRDLRHRAEGAGAADGRANMRWLVGLPFSTAEPPPRYGAIGYVVATVGIAAATGVLLLMLPLLSTASIYLVYLLVVVAVSVGWGLKHGVYASVLGFLAGNFFFTQPLYTFTVAAVQDVIALVAFLGLSTLTSRLVSQLRREAQDARRNEQITATLYALSQTLTRRHDLPSLLNEVASQLCAILDLRACTINIREVSGLGALTVHSGPLLEERALPPEVVAVPLVVGRNTVGKLFMQLAQERRPITKQEERMVAAFAEQLQIAIERAELQHATIQTEVLRRTDALRVALLSAVAHDLRTPLTSIKASASGLLKPPPGVEWGKADQEDMLTGIVEEADRINRLVNNLLDVSRIEAGKMQPHKEPHRIGEVIETVVERLQSTLAEHPLSVCVDANLPAVPMDVVQIDEVLTNLLENAAKYTPKGTPVELSAQREGQAIAVEVADHGPGIPEEHLPQLFSRFYRVTAGKRSGRGANNGEQAAPAGTGLGLAIVKGIVEAHGGHVSAANRPDVGAVFRFTLPVAGEQAESASNTHEEAEEAARVGPVAAAEEVSG